MCLWMGGGWLTGGFALYYLKQLSSSKHQCLATVFPFRKYFLVEEEKEEEERIEDPDAGYFLAETQNDLIKIMKVC